MKQIELVLGYFIFYYIILDLQLFKMTFENQIITEKYINKLRGISKYCNNSYIENRFRLILKYMVGNNLFDNIPLSNSYFSQIDNHIHNDVPFVIKTDLFTELTYLDNINQGGLLKLVKELQKEYSKELTNEQKIRKSLDEGQVLERNEKMIANFIKEYGYDPIENQTFINHNKEEADNDGNTEFIQHIPEDAKKNKKLTDGINENITLKVVTKDAQTDTEPQSQLHSHNENEPQNGNCSLESLNQILDIIEFKFDEILNDMIKEQANSISVITPATVETVPKKKRMTKKEKEAEAAANATENSEVEAVIDKKQQSDEITNLTRLTSFVNDFSKLKKFENPFETKETKETKKIKEEKKMNEEIIETGISAGREIAKYYYSGDILQKSYIKSNMIYVYLIKKFNDPEAMYLLGEELLTGQTIMKNHRQGAKLIKIAAEQYKVKKAIAKMKTLYKV
jgi:hypothetical protein